MAAAVKEGTKLGIPLTIHAGQTKWTLDWKKTNLKWFSWEKKGSDKMLFFGLGDL
jgi:hypothetical protein